MTKEDWKHAGELGDLKDTKYWFKRDIKTIKKSLGKSLKISPLLLIVALILSIAYNYFYNSLVLVQVITTAFAFYLVVVIGYVLFVIIVNKGYNIYSTGAGTIIDEARSPRPKKKIDN